MLTIRELAAIPLLAPLGKRHLADLLRLAADIRLGPGEYVVNEGDEPAFFLVLEGEIEVVKLIDGEERTIGKRGVGQLHGEVPLAYGGAFQAGGRAAIASRVLKVSARQYHLIADEVPGFADAVNDLARERLSGLKGIASAPHPAQVTIVGHRWDTTCVALRRFLSSNQIVFDSLILEAPEFEGHWTGAMPADRDLPLVKLVDGTVLARPNHRQLAERLHLQTVPHHAEYDSVIVGGGPAGLAAAVYGASEGLRTIVIERETPGGQAGTSSRIENYLGFPSGISGDELADRALRQARRLGAEILVTRSIEGIDPETRNITLDGGDVLHARTIILATGVSWRHLALDGFDRLIGRGIYYGASRTEADVTQGLDIHLIGAGNSAGQAAMFFANHARTVALIVRGDSLEKSMSQYLVDQIRGKSNIRVHLQSEVTAVHGDDHLTAIDMADRSSGAVRREDSGGVFIFIGADAETGWLPEAVARDARGYVLTGEDVVRAGQWREERAPYLLETSVPGFFACGDVRFSPVKRVAAAVGEGSMSIAFVHKYLQRYAEGALGAGSPHR